MRFEIENKHGGYGKIMSEGILKGVKNIFRKLARRNVTEEEIHSIIDVGEQEGVIKRDEHAMIDAVLDLGDTLVREILVPRTEMVAVEIATPVTEVLNTIIEAGHSRIPVYEGDVDNIVGILYAKDLLKHGLYWAMASDLHSPDQSDWIRDGIRELVLLAGNSAARELTATRPMQLVEAMEGNR